MAVWSQSVYIRNWGKTIISSGWTRAVFVPHSPVPGSHSSRSSSSLGHSAEATKISSEFCGWKEKCVVLEQNERAHLHHLNVVSLLFSWTLAGCVSAIWWKLQPCHNSSVLAQGSSLRIQNVPICSFFFFIFYPCGLLYVVRNTVRAVNLQWPKCYSCLCYSI